MKTIITVIFFGILTYAVAVANGQCQNSLQPKKDLIVKDFFKNSWFVTHMKDGTKEAACREYKTKLEENDSVIKLNADGEYTFKEQKKFYTTICSSTKGRPLNPAAGPFVLHCRHTYEKDKSNIFFELKLSVIDTDYSNYALVYRCTKYDDTSLNLNYGNFLLLHRSKSGNGSKATTSLQKNQLSLNQFKKTAGC
uniref:Salivary lipocalin n=1 Tax=Triatoma dimidiata TaxID=72491 RepID=D1MWE5_TRIDM|nr:hypothetical protein Td47 similar to salivary lipocalin [Triatoma dimidiata]